MSSPGWSTRRRTTCPRIPLGSPSGSNTAYQILRRRPGIDPDSEFAVIADRTDSAETVYRDKTADSRGDDGGPSFTYRVKAWRADDLSGWSRYARIDLPEDYVASAAPCPGDGYTPTPTAVTVGAVPIVVASTTADYFVLYLTHDLDGTEIELPVLVKPGEAGTTTLAENVVALPKERYRVEKYLVADPADVDGDCIDDISELADPLGMNPVNPAAAIALSDGAVAIPNQETFETLSHLQRHLKFFLFDMDTDRPGVYFQNTKTHLQHDALLDVLGIKWDPDRVTLGTMIYDPELIAPNGSLGVYYFHLQLLFNPFDLQNGSTVATIAYSLLAAAMPLLADNLALHIRDVALPAAEPELSELQLLRDSDIPLVFNEDLAPGPKFQALNEEEGYGLLRALDPGERPNPRDVVIYEVLPNELPRLAGIISTVPQTPLSHVNLRAMQDAIPNAYIRAALDRPDIADLIGAHVHYTVDAAGYSIRAVTKAEVDAHYAASRPAKAQTPQRDPSVTAITPLGEIGFEDWDGVRRQGGQRGRAGHPGLSRGNRPRAASQSRSISTTSS